MRCRRCRGTETVFVGKYKWVGIIRVPFLVIAPCGCVHEKELAKKGVAHMVEKK